MNDTKKIIVITFYFAPFNDTGSYRALKFVKYLPEQGWHPVVLTCENPDYSSVDPLLLNEIPSTVPVIKTRWMAFRSIPRIQTESSDNGHSNSGIPKLGKRWLSKLYHILIQPDDKLTWAISSLYTAYSLCKKHRVTAIYTTSPPHSVHLLGWILSKLLGITWFCDFRDPWIDNVLYQNTNKFWLTHTINRVLEKLVITQSDHVIANTKTNRKRLLERYAKVSPKQISVIYNGFDVNDSPPVMSSHEKLQFTYTGTLYDGMSDVFFRNLNEIVQDHPTWKTQFQIQLIGHRETGIQTILCNLPHLTTVLVLQDKVPRSAAFQALLHSDVLLYFLYPSASAAGWVPSKLYDYLATQKPIFCLGLPGEAQRIIRASRAGIVVNPFNKTAITQQLRIFLTEFQQGTLNVSRNEMFIRHFHRKTQTCQLARMLNQHVSG